MENLLGFIVAGLALAGSPGPNTLSLAAAGAAFGARRSFAFMGGLAVGMVAVMAIVATGVAGVILSLPGATPIVAAVAAGYFAYLAFRIATAPPLSEGTQPDRQPSFGSGVLQSLVNPKAYAAMAAMFSGFVLVHERLSLDVVTKMVVLAAIILIVNVTWLVAGTALTRLLRNRRTNRIVNVTFAVLLIASVAVAFLV